MVVDDDDATRTVLGTILESDGNTVDTCETAEDALARLQSARYDVLITDLVMPGMSGLDLVQAARALHATLRCFVASGHARVADAPLDIGWVAKPIDVDELLARLNGAASDPAPMR